MSNLCLVFGDASTWCDGDEICDATDDPRDATCVECLRRAASYGAAAAMRYAAVEAGASRDPELVRERDDALRRVDAINEALEAQRAFFCHACRRLLGLPRRALHAGTLSWCENCAPHGKAHA